MKVIVTKFLTIILLISGTVCFLGCKKESTEPEKEIKKEDTLETPEAIIEHNLKSGGIYKGTMVGSSGTFKIILQNGTISSEITFEGNSKTLTTSSLNNWSTGEAISNAIFTSGDWQLTFSVDADGSNPQVTISIPSHSIEAIVVKETSSALVTVFEGTYSGGAHGIFNITIKNGVVKGISKSNDSFGNSTISGTVSNNSISGSLSNGVEIIGSINGNNTSGTWTQIVDQNTITGSWTATRKI